MQQKLNKNEIDYIHWDTKTVTLNDFTVELIITDEIWENFQKFKIEEKNKSYITFGGEDDDIQSTGELLRNYLKTNLYTYIRENFEGKLKLKDKEYKIIMIEFDFNQKDIIDFLKMRGKLLKGNKSYLDILEVEQKIERRVKEIHEKV